MDAPLKDTDINNDSTLLIMLMVGGNQLLPDAVFDAGRPPWLSILCSVSV